MKNLQSTTELREFEVIFEHSATQQLIGDQQILTIQSPLDVNKTVPTGRGLKSGRPSRIGSKQPDP